MVASRALLVFALVVPALAAGCSADGDEPAAEEEDVGGSGDALSGGAREGARFATTARLNFREGPSTSEAVQRILPRGEVVTILQASPENGFYMVDDDGDEGWVYGRYLKAAGGGSSTQDEEDDTTPAATAGGTPTGQTQDCRGSFYASGQRTANGEAFNPNGLTAAHKTLPFNTRVRVTNKANGKSVVVRINDRGPFVAGRCIDLARGAFVKIASTSAGVADVHLEILQ